MRQLPMLKFFIKTCLLILFVNVSAQQKNDSRPKDSIVYKTNYGRCGGVSPHQRTDSHPCIQFLHEIVGDVAMRLCKPYNAKVRLRVTRNIKGSRSHSQSATFMQVSQAVGLVDTGPPKQLECINWAWTILLGTHQGWSRRDYCSQITQ